MNEGAVKQANKHIDEVFIIQARTEIPSYRIHYYGIDVEKFLN